MQKNHVKIFALAGNRTPVSRVAGENSTTEPTMRGKWGFSEGVYRHGAHDFLREM